VSAIAQYSGAIIAVKLFKHLDPVTVAWFRVTSASLVLIAFSVRRNHAPWTKRDISFAAVFGIATALMNTFFYLAINRLPLGKGVTIEFIGPILVAAWRTRTARNTAALLVAAVGVTVLGGVELGNQPLGLFYILMASAMWACYIVFGSRVAQNDRGVAGLGVGLAFGSLVILPFGLRDIPRVISTPHFIVGCITVGALSSAIAYGIDQYTLRRIPVRRFSVMLALLPVCSAVMGAVFLSQHPTTWDLCGMALVLGGVAMQEREVISREDDDHQGAPAST